MRKYFVLCKMNARNLLIVKRSCELSKHPVPVIISNKSFLKKFNGNHKGYVICSELYYIQNLFCQMSKISEKIPNILHSLSFENFKSLW